MWDVVVQPTRFGIVTGWGFFSTMVASWLAPQQVQTALAGGSVWDVVVQPSRLGIVTVLILSVTVASWLAPQQVLPWREGGCRTLSFNPPVLG